MGSLLPGWSSPISDTATANKSERNKSLTKEEIQRFWELQQEHHPEPGLADGKARMLKSSSTLPTIFETPGAENPVDMEKVHVKKDDWWTRSNWAFLNEKPQEDVQKLSSNYNSQFHIAHKFQLPMDDLVF